MFSHISTAVASKKNFDAQMSPTTPQHSTVPLSINPSPNEMLDTEIERAESVDYSDVSHCK